MPGPEPDDGATLSTSAADTAGWVSATVPGTVLASLVEQGHFPDPVEGFNNLHIPEALSRHSWWYRRAFDLPPGSRHRRGPARLAGVRRDQPPRRDLAQRHPGRRAHPSLRPRVFDVTERAGRRGAGAGRADQPDAASGQPRRQGAERGLLRELQRGVSRLPELPLGLRLGLDAGRPGPGVGHLEPRAAAFDGGGRTRRPAGGHVPAPNLPDTSVAEVTIVVPVRNASAASQAVTVSCVTR